MVSAPELPTFAVLLRLEIFTDSLKVTAPWVWWLYGSFIFIFLKMFVFLWLEKKAWSLKIMKTNKKGSQEYSGRWEEELGFQWSDNLLHLSHTFGEGLWIPDFECAESAVLEWEIGIKQPKIHTVQTDQMYFRKDKPNNPPNFMGFPYCEISPLCR